MIQVNGFTRHTRRYPTSAGLMTVFELHGPEGSVVLHLSGGLTDRAYYGRSLVAHWDSRTLVSGRKPYGCSHRPQTRCYWTDRDTDPNSIAQMVNRKDESVVWAELEREYALTRMDALAIAIALGEAKVPWETT